MFDEELEDENIPYVSKDAIEFLNRQFNRTALLDCTKDIESNDERIGVFEGIDMVLNILNVMYEEGKGGR